VQPFYFYNFRARWYSSDIGRWLSKDPIGLEGGMNLYVFCGNNPVNFVDPWGLCEESSNWDDFLEQRTIWQLTKNTINFGILGKKPTTKYEKFIAELSLTVMLGSVVPAGGIKFGSSKQLAQELGIEQSGVHAAKSQILKDAGTALKEVGAKNPDIGFTEVGQIVLKNVKTGKTVVTDLLKEWYKGG